MKSSSGEHFLGLDHVRALAAFMVFSWHFIHTEGGFSAPFGNAPVIFPLAILDEGHTGVALFMTLSGYLFAKLLDGKDFHFPSFLWNRFIRLAPLAALVTLYVGITLLQNGLTLFHVLTSFGAGIIFPTLPNGLWSVTVECHFYLVLPLLLAALSKSRKAALPILASAIVLRVILYLWRGQIQYLAYWTIIGRIDQFVLGMVMFQCSSLLRGKHAIALATAFLFAAYYWLFDYAGGYTKMPSIPSPSALWIIMPTVEGAAYALLIAYYDTTFKAPNEGVSWFIGLIGAYSYSIYLLHQFFIPTAAEFINLNIMNISNFYVAQTWALLCFILMVPIGYLSFRFIEAPFLKLRKRYIKVPKTLDSEALLRQQP